MCTLWLPIISASLCPTGDSLHEVGEVATEAGLNSIQPTGNGNQGVYLAEVSQGFATTLLAQMNRTVDDFEVEEEVQEEQEAEAAQQSLQGRTDIGEPQKQQMVSARRGQGVFKAKVRLNEKACRITGVTILGCSSQATSSPGPNRTPPKSSTAAMACCSPLMSIAFLTEA